MTDKPPRLSSVNKSIIIIIIKNFLFIQRLAPEGIIIIHKICITLYTIIKYGNYHGRLIGKAPNGLHSNVLLRQITISNTRNKRVNENITTCCTHSQ